MAKQDQDIKTLKHRMTGDLHILALCYHLAIIDKRHDAMIQSRIYFNEHFVVIVGSLLDVSNRLISRITYLFVDFI